MPMLLTVCTVNQFYNQRPGSAHTHSHHPILKPLLITIKIKKIGSRTVQECLLESRRTKRAGVFPCNLNLL